MPVSIGALKNRRALCLERASRLRESRGWKRIYFFAAAFCCVAFLCTGIPVPGWLVFFSVMATLVLLGDDSEEEIAELEKCANSLTKLITLLGEQQIDTDTSPEALNQRIAHLLTLLEHGND